MKRKVYDMEKYIALAMVFGAVIYLFAQPILFANGMAADAGAALGQSLLSGDYLNNSAPAAKFLKP